VTLTLWGQPGAIDRRSTRRALLTGARASTLTSAASTAPQVSAFRFWRCQRPNHLKPGHRPLRERAPASPSVSSPGQWHQLSELRSCLVQSSLPQPTTLLLFTARCARSDAYPRSRKSGSRTPQKGRVVLSAVTTPSGRLAGAGPSIPAPALFPDGEPPPAGRVFSPSACGSASF